MVKKLFKYFSSIADEFCEGNATTEVCQTYTGGNLRCVNAFPGFNSLILTQNMDSVYLQVGILKFVKF